MAATRNSKQLVQRTLAGLAVPRPVVGPLAVHYCARWADTSIEDYTTDADKLAESVLCYYKRFRPDAVWISADTWVTAQAMGAAVGFPGKQQPMCGIGKPLIQTPGDLERVPAPDPHTQGRCPVMLEAARQVVQQIGDQVFVVACFDQYPFSLACALMGVDRLMLALIDDRPFAEAVIEVCSHYTIAYARALAATGVDMLSGGDSPAGLIGPDLYRQVALPAEKKMIQSLRHSCNQPISLHICGDATAILTDMASSGADVLELDHCVQLRLACQTLGADVGIWGNLDPVQVLARGSPADVELATRAALQTAAECRHPRFVLSSGCTLAAETPPENVEAMITTTRQFIPGQTL